MRRSTTSAALCLAAALLAVAVVPARAETVEGRDMHRLYNQWTGEHLYTASVEERDTLERIGWTYEGVGWVAPTWGKPVYRLYNPYVPGGDHHYTLDETEYEKLGKIGWSQEGEAWYSGGTVPLYRQFNPYAKTGTHNYTTDKAENDALVKAGWNAEGVAWYGIAGVDGYVDPTWQAEQDRLDQAAAEAKASLDAATEKRDATANRLSALEAQIGSKETELERLRAQQPTLSAREFFSWLGGDAAVAADVLSGKLVPTTMDDGTLLQAHTHPGERGDATYIDNMYVGLDIVDECNRIRRHEGLPELKVTSLGTAIAMLNANWSADVMSDGGGLQHAANNGASLRWGENLSWNYASVEDSFVGWYWSEKANATGQTQVDFSGGRHEPYPGGETGHYENIIDGYVVTGGAYASDGRIMVQDFGLRNIVAPDGAYGEGVEIAGDAKSYSTAEYRALLDKFVSENVSADLLASIERAEVDLASLTSQRKAAEDELRELHNVCVEAGEKYEAAYEAAQTHQWGENWS